jgi:hypothetical protein
MRKPDRRLVSALAGCVVGLAGVFVATTPASAAATATNIYRDNNLPYKYCYQGHYPSIHLAHGTYTWTVFVRDTGHENSESITLEAGDYLWMDCLEENSDGYWYDMSYLSEINSSNPTAILVGDWGVFDLKAFGSTLDPQF